MRGIGKVAGLAACIVATGLFHAAMPTAGRASRGELFVPRPEVAKISALGFDAAVSDYYWMQAVQIVGGDNYAESKGPLLAALIDVVTTLDPWVDHPYRFAGAWLTYDVPTVEKANVLMERGIAHHPDDWRMYFYLGFNHFFYLGDEDAAVSALEQALHLEAAPFFLRPLVARLVSDDGGLDAAEAFLHGLILQADSEDEKARYDQALGEIAAERVARKLDAARAEYKARNGRDIETVEDLTKGPKPVLAALPPEPHGGKWIVEEWTKLIVSDVVGHRYETKIDEVNRRRIREFRARGAQPEGDRG